MSKRTLSARVTPAEIHSDNAVTFPRPRDAFLAKLSSVLTRFMLQPAAKAEKLHGIGYCKNWKRGKWKGDEQHETWRSEPTSAVDQWHCKFLAIRFATPLLWQVLD